MRRTSEPSFVARELDPRVLRQPVESDDLGIYAFQALLLGQGQDDALHCALSGMKLADNMGYTHEISPFEGTDRSTKGRGR